MRPRPVTRVARTRTHMVFASPRVICTAGRLEPRGDGSTDPRRNSAPSRRREASSSCVRVASGDRAHLPSALVIVASHFFDVAPGGLLEPLVGVARRAGGEAVGDQCGAVAY